MTYKEYTLSKMKNAHKRRYQLYEEIESIRNSDIWSDESFDELNEKIEAIKNEISILKEEEHKFIQHRIKTIQEEKY